MTIEKLRKIVIFKNLLKQGLNQRKASIGAGLDCKNVHKYIKKYNLESPNKGKQYLSNDNYFDNVDTETKAYLLGFLLADGYLITEKSKRGHSSYRVCLNNSIDDKEMVTLFRDEISPQSKVFGLNKQKGVGFRKPQLIVRITSKHLYKTLEDKYGIVQNKTQNDKFKFDFSTVPKHLIRHFIRGYFDGDGSVSFHMYRNQIFFNFCFIFNSVDFCNQIADIFQNKFDIRPVIYTVVGKTCTTYALRFDYSRKRGSKIGEIYNYLYKDSTVFLNRKKVKFENYFKHLANSASKKNGVV